MPRSPSRDLSDRYIGKRGYFRRWDTIRRWKYVLAAGAFVASVGWAAIDVVQPSRANYAHTHGPLAGPHAAFDDNCAACHIAQTPDLNPFAVFGARDRWHALSCGKCHAGPNDNDFAHHASATKEAREFHNRCSNCHHDHLGRLNSLVRHPDADCNQCHRDLAKWHDADKSLTKKKGEQPYLNKITGFSTDHPEFRSLETAPPRTLKFSHAFHMNPGFNTEMTLPALGNLYGADVAKRYTAPKQPDNLVRLQCASCHTLDSGTADTDQFKDQKKTLTADGQPSRAFLPPRAEGAYFQPVNYELSCRACHPLQAPAKKIDPQGREFIPAFDVAHGKQPKELVADLEAGYLKRLLAEKRPELAELPKPGGEPDTNPNAKKALNAEVEQLTVAAKKHLFTERPKPAPGERELSSAGCFKCHQQPAVRRETDPPSIERVPDRTVWLEHARFNHSAHRGVTCATCHPGTETDPKFDRNAALVEKEPVKDFTIRGIDSCKACHAPAGTVVKLPKDSKIAKADGTTETLPEGSTAIGGGVRHNCTDCHRYHHGDLPMQSRGSASRFPKDPRELADWLKGK